MNIKITHNWLLDFLQTDASPFEIQKYLSLAGPSIEKVEPIINYAGQTIDYLYDIEIISNRIDTASVWGITQEALAILPMHGKKANLKNNPLLDYRFNKIKDFNQKKYSLQIKIEKDNLCSRFTACILDGIQIAPSPQFIQDRLQAAGVKIINNVVDISNYLMLTLGQPVHIFDFEKIAQNNMACMIMREAKKGEKVATLDGKEIVLTGEDIVIEDGQRRLIDLCGIMGGLNSCVSQNTKKIILFVQTYNKAKIRKTTMTTGIRTLAATYFEKGLDEERVEPTLVYGLKLLQQYAKGGIASKLYDIYPFPYKQKEVTTTLPFFKKIMGVDIDKKDIINILENLGFKTKVNQQELRVSIPSYRKYDILIPEDLVEEVARVYGYHKITDNLPPPAFVEQPLEFHRLFKIVNKIKVFLKHLGLNEVINYSMISKKMIDEWGLDEKKHLQLANTISEEIEYMRLSLLPSLYKNIKDNYGKKDTLKFFEIAKVYLPKDGDLPEEKYRLAMVFNTDYFDLKGVIEALINELNIENNNIVDTVGKETIYQKIFLKNNCATWLVEKNAVGFLGQVKNGEKIYMAEIDLEKLMKYSRPLASYQTINPFSVIKLDLTFDKKMPYIELKRKAYQSSSLLNKIEIIDIFKNKITLRLYFSSTKRNITEEEAKNELKKIKKILL